MSQRHGSILESSSVSEALAEHQDDEQTAAEYAQEPAFYLKQAERQQAIADKFIAEQQPWMAEGYQILASMYRKTAAAVAAQEA